MDSRVAGAHALLAAACQRLGSSDRRDVFAGKRGDLEYCGGRTDRRKRGRGQRSTDEHECGAKDDPAAEARQEGVAHDCCEHRTFSRCGRSRASASSLIDSWPNLRRTGYDCEPPGRPPRASS